MNTTKSIGYYLGMFVLSFIGLTILVGIIGAFLKSSMTGMAAVVPFVSAAFAGGRFLKVEQRRPTDAERKKLTNGSFFIFVGVNLVFGGLIVGVSLINGVGSGSANSAMILTIIGLFLGFVFLIAYFMIRWAYGGLLNKQADKMNLSQSTFD